mmetsp:Transcript_59307/g.193437  ORF Transcript_59307/g.193437 Transcript_59307/m.193437 type:complete len:193 (-) Transcript_59307:160-738(-)
MVVGHAWQEAAAVTHDIDHDVFDDDFWLKLGKGSLNITRSQSDDDLFSDPFAGVHDTGIQSFIPNEKTTSGRHLPPMKHVAPARGPAREHRAPRHNLQLDAAAASFSGDGARGLPLEKEDEDEWFATPSPPSLDTSVVPGGVPQEPKGARPTNRRPAHSKTAATRAATSGVEPPEEQMASGGHGRTLMRMSL